MAPRGLIIPPFVAKPFLLTMTDTPHTPAKTWSGRFAEPVSERVKRYTASIPFDRRLAEHDIRGSLAHAKCLRVKAS